MIVSFHIVNIAIPTLFFSLYLSLLHSLSLPLCREHARALSFFSLFSSHFILFLFFFFLILVNLAPTWNFSACTVVAVPCSKIFVFGGMLNYLLLKLFKFLFTEISFPVYLKFVLFYVILSVVIFFTHYSRYC